MLKNGAVLGFFEDECQILAEGVVIGKVLINRAI